jgi:hypothetical protein
MYEDKSIFYCVIHFIAQIRHMVRRHTLLISLKIHILNKIYLNFELLRLENWTQN